MAALIYGVTGYTGRLIANLAAVYGIRPILAGRDARAVTALAHELGYDYRVFSLDDATTIEESLDDVRVVLHCAGPFSRTFHAMASACIRRGVHYVDITGEIEVFEALHARDAEARRMDVMLLPGAGFDVVPSDCLAAYLKQKLPSATHLQLGIRGSGRLSHGTASTMVEHIDRGGMVRRNGKLTRVPAGWRTREVDYGIAKQKAITIPWGDVATSYYSTGIANIEVYAAASAQLRTLMKLSRFARPLLSLESVKRRLQKLVPAGGPSENELQRGSSAVWGRVSDPAGQFVEARIIGPNGYLLTAHCACLIVRRILSGNSLSGFQTPSLAYGADLILEVPGVRREDV